MPRPNSAPAPTPPAAPSGQPQTAGRHGVGEGLRNVYFLGIKEFYSLLRDYALLFVIVFMFTGAVLADARAKPDSLSNAAIAVVDATASSIAVCSCGRNSATDWETTRASRTFLIGSQSQAASVSIASSLAARAASRPLTFVSPASCRNSRLAWQPARTSFSTSSRNRPNWVKLAT